MSKEKISNLEEIFSNNHLNRNVYSQYNSTQPSQNCDAQSLNLCILSPVNQFKQQLAQGDLLKYQNHEVQSQSSSRQTERLAMINSAPDMIESKNYHGNKKKLLNIYSQQIIKLEDPNEWLQQKKQAYEISQDQKAQTRNLKSENDKSKQIKELEEKSSKIKKKIIAFGFMRVFSLFLLISCSIYTYLWFFYAVGLISQSDDKIKLRVMDKDNLSDTYLVYIPIVLQTISYLVHLCSNIILRRKLKKENEVSERLIIYLKIQFFSLDLFPFALIIIYSTILDSPFKITGAIIYTIQLFTQLYYIRLYQSYINNYLKLSKLLFEFQTKNSIHETSTVQNY